MLFSPSPRQIRQSRCPRGLPRTDLLLYDNIRVGNQHVGARGQRLRYPFSASLCARLRQRPRPTNATKTSRRLATNEETTLFDRGITLTPVASAPDTDRPRRRRVAPPASKCSRPETTWMDRPTELRLSHDESFLPSFSGRCCAHFEISKFRVTSWILSRIVS